MVLVLSAIVLAACGSDEFAKPGDNVTLTFTGKSNSAYRFVLENPTSHSIYFRRWRSLLWAMIPVDTAFDCENDKGREATIGGFPLFDSVTGGKDPPTIELPPGKAVKLRLEISETGSELAKHRGEACQLRLMLRQPNGPSQQAEVVESQVFQP
jgi:hypothetical protein